MFLHVIVKLVMIGLVVASLVTWTIWLTKWLELRTARIAVRTTALGLIAAIPAVMIYNVLARSTAQYRALLGDASAQVIKLVSRDLDRAKLPLSQAAE
jgi:biopolymer transport protein ExbB/TolQ